MKNADLEKFRELCIKWYEDAASLKKHADNSGGGLQAYGMKTCADELRDLLKDFPIEVKP